jgi:hypothetical protein
VRFQQKTKESEKFSPIKRERVVALFLSLRERERKHFLWG